MNRSLFTSSFSLDSFPHWLCPVCGRGIIRPKKNTVQKFETIDSKNNRNDPNWEPNWASADFFMTLQCTDNKCGQVVLCIGTAQVEEFTYLSEENRPELDYHETYSPTFLSLPMNIFEIPRKCPLKVSKEILNSFYLFFADPSAALNHARSAVEVLLTHLQVAKFVKSKGKLVRIKLHDRIEIFEKNKPDIAQKLFAIKWMGNAGSHPITITRENVLDAYEILEDVLISLFEKRDIRLRQLVNQINKRKGPLNAAKRLTRRSS